MSFSKILKSAAFSYLLLANPQVSQGLLFNNAYDETRIISDNQGFCDARNLSFYDPSYFEENQSQGYFYDRDVKDFDSCYAFGSSVDIKNSWVSSVSSLASTTYDYVYQFIFPRKALRNKFFEAIEQNDLMSVSKLLEENEGNVDIQRWGEEALSIAAREEHWEVFKLLVNAKIIADDYLYEAIKAGHKDIVECIIKSGVDVNKNILGKPPIIHAIEQGNVDIVNEFILARADVNWDLTADRDISTELVKRNESLNHMSINEQMDLEEHPITQISEAKNTPLLVAIHHKKLDLIKKLVEAGADINHVSDNFITPLKKAMNIADLDIIYAIIELGAEISDQDLKSIKLYEAIQNDNDKVVRDLINDGADVNYKNTDDLPPILFVVLKRNKTIFNLLYKAGAGRSLEFHFLHLKEIMFLASEFEIYEYDQKILKEELMLQLLLGHIFEFEKTKYLDFRFKLNGIAPKADQINMLDNTIYNVIDTFFSKFPEYKKNIDTEGILSAFKKSVPLLHENSDSQVVDIDKIRNPNESVIIHGGWEEERGAHAIDITFSDNYLIIANKGARPSDANQIEVYKINREAPNTEKIIEELTVSKTEEESNDLLYNRLPKAFQGKKDWICNVLSLLINNDQETGNCAWESQETDLEALIGLDYFLKHQKYLQNEKISKIVEHVDAVHEMMEHFREYAKWYILDKYEDFHKKNTEIEKNEDLLQKAKANLDLRKVNRIGKFFKTDIDTSIRRDLRMISTFPESE
ncbi:MAG: hypothetical protein K1060chlam4_00399 [Candidatus Anoxychlamydiales bacterium]|nr:hypothetical protein [Candidatus Anoxychlamydiales bacterium]